MSGKFDCLNDAVRGTGADTDVSPGCFDRLMVETVHINARAYKLFELLATFDFDAVADISSGCGLLCVVERRLWDKGKILPDCSAAGNI